MMKYILLLQLSISSFVFSRDIVIKKSRLSKKHFEEVKASEEEEEGLDPGIVALIVIIVLIFIALLAVGFYFFAKWRGKQIKREYTMNPESFLASQNLTMIQKLRLAQWRLDLFGENKLKNFKFTKKNNPSGNVFELAFSQMLGATASVMSSSPLTESKEFSYFELEITEMGNTDTNIAIGFCNKVDFNNNLLPGVYANSVGLHSFTGEVFSSGNKAASFEFSCVYGETIGIGIRSKDGRIWISKNGVFLNPPAPSEKPSADKDKIQREKDWQNMDPEDVVIEKDKLEAIEKAAKGRKATLRTANKELFPIIGCNGPCKLLLNVGGSLFRLYQKELATGLI